LFIVFEGIDGSGKTTQVELLSQKLTSIKKPNIIVREPGGTSIGEAIRKELKNNPDLDPVTQLLLFSACRTQLIKEVINPNLKNNQIVISDRYVFSTIAYQGYADGLDTGVIQNLINISTEGLIPDLVIFIDTPIETAKARRETEAGDHFDNKPLDYYKRIRDGYLSISSTVSNWVTIYGTDDPQEISKLIWQKIRPLI
tara:strand:- start:2515 stop:3111 length:597 start_codon:yes stop_codon:yes gene_type:complete